MVRCRHFFFRPSLFFFSAVSLRPGARCVLFFFGTYGTISPLFFFGLPSFFFSAVSLRPGARCVVFFRDLWYDIATFFFRPSLFFFSAVSLRPGARFRAYGTISPLFFFG